MTVNFANLFASLEIMWKGMAGLFIVCGAIAVLIMFVSKIMTDKERKNRTQHE